MFESIISYSSKFINNHMLEVRIPLSVPRNRRSEYLKNYRSLTKNSGRLLLVAGDQKVEHLNDDFYGSKVTSEDNDPEHLFKIAAASQDGVLATQLGLISRYGHDYRDLSYIVKLNGKTNIGSNEEKNSSFLWWTVTDIIKFKQDSGLDIVGLGYTIYLGNKYEAEMLNTAAQMINQAHQAGLTAIIWMYPRGKNILEEDIHTIAGGAGVAASLDADFVKIKYPYDAKNKKITAERFKEATVAAGRTKVVCACGDKRPVPELLEQIEKQIKISGTSGLAMGRNLHQRPLAEAKRLSAALSAILFHGKNHQEALAIYNNTEKKKEPVKSKRLFGL